MRTHAGFGRWSLVALALAAPCLLAATSAFASGVTPTDATPVQREEAQTRFAHARDLYAAKKLDEAHDEFEKSYGIVASPNALLFVARCDRDRGRLVAAYAEYGRTVAEAREHASEDPRYAKTADAASAEREEIAPRLAFLIVSVERGADDSMVSIGGERFGRSEWGEAVPVIPGASEIVLTTPGRADLRRAVTLSAGERKAISLDAGPAPVAARASAPPIVAPSPNEPAPSPSHTTRSLAYGAAAVAGAGLVTFAVSGLLANGTYGDLQTKCHGRCPVADSSEISRGKTEQTVADVGLVVGLVGAAAAVTLFVVGAPGTDHVAVVARPSWVGLEGAF